MTEQSVSVSPFWRLVVRCTGATPALAALAAAALLAGCGGDAPAAGTPQGAADTAQPAESPAPATSPAPPASHELISGPPPIAFEPPVLDIGLLSMGEAGTGTVKVRNVGDRTITIRGTRATCACAYAKDLSGTVLAPGEAVDLTATLTPRGGPGKKKEQIGVIVAGYTQYLRVDVIGEVALALRAIPPGLEAYKVGLQGPVEVGSLDGEPFRVLRADGKPPQYVGFDPGADAPRN
ncbi:MAG: Ig-like domain-containing protein, partial [Planctomycetota bacterium]